VIETDSLVFKDIGSIVFAYELFELPHTQRWRLVMYSVLRSEVIPIAPQTALWTQMCVVKVHIYERVHLWLCDEW